MFGIITIYNNNNKVIMSIHKTINSSAIHLKVETNDEKRTHDDYEWRSKNKRKNP